MDLPLARRRQLRTNSADPEAIIWRHLRAHRFAEGITVLRFQNDWVLRELDGVLAVIAASLGVADPSP